MDSDEIDIPDEWHAVSGFVPLLEVEHRLAVLRRAIGGTTSFIVSLHQDATKEAAEQLGWIRADPEAALYEGEAEVFLNDQILAVRDELPLMLLGTLIVYQFSLLEHCLAGCLENAAAIRRQPPPGRVSNPKIESFIDELRAYGVPVEWDDDLWRELRSWRSVRNALVHRLEASTGFSEMSPEPGSAEADERNLLTTDGLESLVELIEEAIEEVDLAMSRIDKS